MNKIIGFFLLLVTLFIISVFKAPAVALKIENLVGLNGASDFIIIIKEKIDGISSATPSKDELIDKYNEAYSGALELKDDIKEGIDSTKDKIDTVREAVDKTQESIKETTQAIEGTLETINDLQETVSGLTGTGESN